MFSIFSGARVIVDVGISAGAAPRLLELEGRVHSSQILSTRAGNLYSCACMPRVKTRITNGFFSSPSQVDIFWGIYWHVLQAWDIIVLQWAIQRTIVAITTYCISARYPGYLRP